MLKLSELIRDSRKKQKLTQEQLAEKLNVQATTIQNWEAGRNNPDQTTLKQVVSVLKIEPIQLTKVLVHPLFDEVGVVKEKATLKWVEFLPEVFKLDFMEDLIFNETEQKLFQTMVLCSKFKANPIPEMREIIPNQMELLLILDKFEKLSLDSPNGRDLSAVSHWIASWMLKHPNELFDVSNLSLSEFLKLCRVYGFNVPTKKQLLFMKGLVANPPYLLQTYLKSNRFTPKWIKIDRYYRNYAGDFSWENKELVEELIASFEETYSYLDQISKDYFRYETLELNNPAYLKEKEVSLLEKELYLTKYGQHKESDYSSSFEILTETYLYPSEKTLRLIEALEQESLDA